MEDIHDIKGLVPVPHHWWWIGLVLGVVIAAVLIWFLKRRAIVPAKPSVPPPTPFEAALAALQRLRSDNPPVEEFYTRLSDIIRQYLEKQFRLHAPERTTEEFLYEVQQGSQLAPEHKQSLGGFLQQSDLVKFARLRPEESDRQRAFEAAEKFVRDSIVTR